MFASSRFVLGWKKLGLETSLGTRLVIYADDLVILCRRGNAEAAEGELRGDRRGSQKFLAGYRWFESISLQQTVCLSSAAAFEGREPGFPRGFARMAWRPRRQRRRDVLISLRRAAMSLSGRIPVPQ